MANITLSVVVPYALKIDFVIICPCLHRGRFLKCFSTIILICSATASTSEGYTITKGSFAGLLFTLVYFIVVCRVFKLHVGMVLAECGIFREHLLWWHTYKIQLSLLRAASTFTGLLLHSRGQSHKQTILSSRTKTYWSVYRVSVNVLIIDSRKPTVGGSSPWEEFRSVVHCSVV